jgi:hypothetical protein
MAVTYGRFRPEANTPIVSCIFVILVECSHSAGHAINKQWSEIHKNHTCPQAFGWD